MSWGRFLGATFLITGTCVGAGMLALPVVVAEAGFWRGMLALLLFWLMGLLSGFYTLELSLRFPNGSHFITMAKKTLGPWGALGIGAILTILMFALLCAYTSAGSGLVHACFSSIHLKVPTLLEQLIFIFFFGMLVFTGVAQVDYMNRFLMSLKFFVYFMLVFAMLPYVRLALLPSGQSGHGSALLGVMLTSFGFSIVIPSLKDYMADDLPSLKRAIIVGTTLALALYILWNSLVLGVVDAKALAALKDHEQAASAVAMLLQDQLNIARLTQLAYLFTVICVMTSFLSIALSLSDFISDGIRCPKRGLGTAKVFVLTFAPPLVVLMLQPNIFVGALHFGGTLVGMLHIILTGAMVFRARYVLPQTVLTWQLGGGIPLLLLWSAMGTILTLLTFWSEAGF